MLALAVVASLLGGCAAGRTPSSGPTPSSSGAAAFARPTRSAPAGTSTVGVSARARRRDGLPTLLPPGCAPGQLRLGRRLHDGGAGEIYTFVALRLVRGPACTLWGTPTVRLTAADGSPAPETYLRRWLWPQHIRPVAVSRQRPQYVALETTRCDATPTSYTRMLSVVLPQGAGTVAGVVPIGYCGLRQRPNRVYVAALGTWSVRRRPAPRDVAVSMHSRFSARGLATWGRADLAGNGHSDLVLVRPGLVTARVGGRLLRVRVPRAGNDELQGLADLTGDARPDILVGVTALGCSAGYRYCASGATVVSLLDGRLRIVRFPADRPQWDDGQGDLFEGWVCRSGGPTEIDLALTGASTYELNRTRYVVSGLRARRAARTTQSGSGATPRLLRLTRTRCAGLDRWGWAAERGPLG